MFKRVEKRRKKREEEDELGLDEDMKDILGMQDTDSDESESGSDSDEPSNDGGSQNGGEGKDIVIEQQGRKRKRDNEDEEEEEEEEADEGESGEDDDGNLKQPTLTVQEALKDPLYILSLQPDIKGCIVCPGKLLKNSQMFQLHKASKAHVRRFKLFNELTAEASPNENAWDILQSEVSPKSKAPKTSAKNISKRAEKRRAKTATITAMRERQKAMKAKAKAKKPAKAVDPSVDIAAPSPSKTTEPAKKKRKTDPATDDLPQRKVETPSISVIPVKSPAKHPSRGVAKKRAKSAGPRSERLQRKRAKDQYVDSQTPTPGRKGKPNPRRTKESKKV